MSADWDPAQRLVVRKASLEVHKCSTTYAAVGEPCGPQPDSDNVACATGDYCEAPRLQGGTCRAKKQPGDACTGTTLFECDGNGGHCDAATYKCLACPF